MIIVVDIDGVVVEPKGYNPMREYFVGDWEKFTKEICEGKPIPEGVILVQSLMAGGHDIVFLTGRPIRCQSETSLWLSKHGLGEYDKLILRDRETHEDPPLFKLEKCKEIKPNLVIDDDQNTTKVLSENGLSTLLFLRKGWNV